MISKGRRGRSHGRRVLAAVVALATVGALAACSKSEDDEAEPTTAAASDTTSASDTTGVDDTQPATTEPATRTTRGVTDDTVKVGGIIWATQFGGADVGARIRIERANAEGGVNGRQVELVTVEDDTNDTATNLAAAQKLVRQEEVFAILPMLSSGIGSIDFLTEEQVPFFGWGVHPAFCQNEIGFGITGCVTDPDLKRGSNAMGTALKERFDGDTDKSIALLAEDTDGGRGGLVLLENSLSAIGFDVVYAEPAVPAPPAAVGDFTPFANEVMAADAGEPPDMIMLQLSTTNALSMSEILQQRYDGIVITPFYDPRLVASPSLEGQLILTQFLPYEWADENERLQQMLDDVAAYDEANGGETLHTLALAAGYWSADFFLSILEATGEDLTVERFLATGNGGFEYEVEGVIGPSTWPNNHNFPVPCAAFARVEGGAYVRDVPLICGENFEL